MTKTTSNQEEETTKSNVQILADNEHMRDGVLYRDDLRVGADGLNSRERGDKKRLGPDPSVGADGLTSAQRG